MKEMGKRKKQEQKGEAEEGYARAMLLSPLQSLSPPLSNSSHPEVNQYLKATTAISDELLEISAQPHAGPTQKPLHPPPEHGADHPPTLTRGQKRTRTEAEEHEDESVDQRSRQKRQRRETPTAHRNQETVPITANTQGVGKSKLNVSKTKIIDGPKTGNSPAPLNQRTLPWKLRPRDIVSYRETGTKTATRSRRRPGKRKVRQRKSRL